MVTKAYLQGTKKSVKKSLKPIAKILIALPNFVALSSMDYGLPRVKIKGKDKDDRHLLQSTKTVVVCILCSCLFLFIVPQFQSNTRQNLYPLILIPGRTRS